jgi:hypothetical protein
MGKHFRTLQWMRTFLDKERTKKKKQKQAKGIK